ncbi:tetratricopeptide repeat protein [Rudanella lutea]|uniref:tetratricopeptide repeat protein n=1 Tax=Rudanella lutea TaxID=451374 RepID=UPI000373D390
MNRYPIYIIICLHIIGLHVTAKAQELTGQQREAYVQKAVQLRKEENYSAAIIQLDSILAKNPKDAGILLFKGDLKLQSNRFSEAVDVYKELLLLNYEPTIARINLSYALFMNHRPAKALYYAAEAWTQNKTNPSATVNYFNAMLWNSQTKQAAQFLSAQDSLLSPAQRLVLKARLYTTSGNYTKGLAFYDSLVRAFPDKHYLKEYSEVLLGKKEIKRSRETMQQHQTLFSATEYHSFTQKLKAAQFQNAGTEFVYFSDIAKNTRIEQIAWFQQHDGVRYRFRLSAGTSAITSVEGQKTTSQFAHVTINERFNKAWSGQTDLHLQTIRPEVGRPMGGLLGKQTIQYQPNDRRMIGLYYNGDVLNYTASLLEKNIRSNNFGYVTHILLSGKTGIYSQGSFGMLTDQNQRYQFFGSLYHLFRTEPTLKAGVNISALHFTNNTITAYFAPNRYLSSEVFADYSTALPHLSRFYFQSQAGVGMQQIETQAWQPAFRVQGEVGFRANHFETSLKYQTSNVASAVGTGYAFDWYTLRLLLKW